jgi:Holliday junction resolvasome RuvABC endonuclease subunit
VWLRTVHTAPAGDDPHGWHTARRHNLLVNEVRAMVEGGRTVAAVEERPPIRDAADPTMAAVRAVICLGLYAARVPLAAVHLARVKAYASGTGNATKAHMMQAANVAHQQLTDGVPLPKNADNNACDAFFLALMAYQKYGCTPPFLATPKRIEVVNRVTWPVFP